MAWETATRTCPLRIRGEKRGRKGGHGDLHQALGAPRLSGACCRRDPGAAPYRQCGGDNRRGVVDPGLRPRRGHRVPSKWSPITRRRAATRSTTASSRTRRCARRAISAITSGAVPDMIEIADFALAPLQCVGRQADRRQRRRRARKKRNSSDTALPCCLFLQQRHEKARLLRRAGEDRGGPVPHLEVAGRKGRFQDLRSAEDLGRLHGFLQAGAEGAAGGRASATSTGSATS